MSLPKDPPESLPSALGPIPVSVVPGLNDPDIGLCYGLTSFQDRTIQLTSGMHPTTLWQTLWHEATHVILQDSGVTKLVDDPTEEAICNAVGTFLAAAQAQGYLTVHSPALNQEGRFKETRDAERTVRSGDPEG